MKTIITPDHKVVVLNDGGTWSYAPSSGSVIERWRSLKLRQDLIELFRGVFDRLGVRIVDTGEAFTCVHRGDRIEFVGGVDEKAVDTTVKIYGYQADRLARQIENGVVEEIEWFRVARELFVSGVAAARSVVENPLSSNVVLRRAIGAKNVVHVFLISPDLEQEPNATFTLIHVNRQSLLVPGLHGTPERVFHLVVADALEVQRILRAGLKAAKPTERLKIAKKYVAWRKKVEARARG